MHNKQYISSENSFGLDHCNGFLISSSTSISTDDMYRQILNAKSQSKATFTVAVEQLIIILSCIFLFGFVGFWSIEYEYCL